jgi:hypothetical protein
VRFDVTEHPSALAFAQSAQPRLFQFLGPAADRLSMRADLSRDLRLAESCSEQSRRALPTRRSPSAHLLDYPCLTLARTRSSRL